MRPPQNSSEIPQKACEELTARARAMLRYLGQLQARIDGLRFPVDDKLRREVENAFNAMHGLHITLHYMTCDRSKIEQPPLDVYKKHRQPQSREPGSARENS